MSLLDRYRETFCPVCYRPTHEYGILYPIPDPGDRSLRDWREEQALYEVKMRMALANL